MQRHIAPLHTENPITGILNMKKLLWLLLLATAASSLPAAEKNTGRLGNLVVFLRFFDEPETIFEKPYGYYETMFNDSSENANSVYNYFKEASYGQLFWVSVFYPASETDGTIVSYRAQHPRGYYRKYSSINPDGYEDDAVGANKLSREQSLVKELADYLDTVVPADALIDADGNGVVDNVCIIVSGRSEIGGSHLLWPHRSTLYMKEGFVAGKRVGEYIMLFDDANGFGSGITPLSINTGVLCHEMSHTLGTYDLYHGGVRTDLNPVGVWDLMSDNLTAPQSMSAYTKYKYCKWIDEIPEISAPGTYTLNPLNGKSRENIAYKIKPRGSDQYFVVEYRRKTGVDAGLPESGLLVYRVDPRYTGNNAYDGTSKFDELYLFRPGGTPTADGHIDRAAFSRESGRTAFGGNAEYRPFYTDGKTARFAIGNVSDCGETLSFDLLPVASLIYLTADSVVLSGNAGSSTQLSVEADTSWQIVSVPDWLEVSPRQGRSGTTRLTVTALSKNDASSLRKARIVLSAIDEVGVSSTLTVVQTSGDILAPTGLTAESSEGKVFLSWRKPVSGEVVLDENFENETTAASWTIRKDSENRYGWARTAADKYTEAADGEFAMKLFDDRDDMHQDEWVISPSFAQGELLSFHSKSIAPQKNNPHNFYYVLASRDGGETWEIAYDLKTESEAVNRYEQIDIDLSAYRSDDMRIAFHAYDDNDEGLSYWWIIDKILVYPATDDAAIEGYFVYRNGEKIATVATPGYTDENPVADALYQVSAYGSFGETALSQPAGVTVAGNLAVELSGESRYDAAAQLLILPEGAAVTLIAVGGQVLLHERSNTGMVDLHTLPAGYYIADISSRGKREIVRIVK